MFGIVPDTYSALSMPSSLSLSLLMILGLTSGPQPRTKAQELCKTPTGYLKHLLKLWSFQRGTVWKEFRSE